MVSVTAIFHLFSALAFGWLLFELVKRRNQVLACKRVLRVAMGDRKEARKLVVANPLEHLKSLSDLLGISVEVSDGELVSRGYSSIKSGALVMYLIEHKIEKMRISLKGGSIDSIGLEPTPKGEGMINLKELLGLP